MDSREAVMSYAQSEKVKSGLIWITQLSEMIKAMDGEQRIAGESIVQSMIAFVANEAGLANRITGNTSWAEVEKYIEKARIMLHSGVFEEVTWHLTQALSRTTGIGQQSMTYLLENKLI